MSDRLSVSGIAVVFASMLFVLWWHSPLPGESRLFVVPGEHVELIGIDFEVYRAAGQRWAADRSPYEDRLFIYPPGFAWAFARFDATVPDAYRAYLPLSRVIFVLVPLLLIWPYRSALGALPRGVTWWVSALLVTACGFWEAFRMSYAMVNIDHAIFFVIALSWLLYTRGAPALSGALVGFVAGMKLVPIMILGVVGAAVLSSVVRRVRPAPGLTSFTLAGVTAAAAVTVPFFGLLDEFAAHYRNVESGARTFSLASVLGHFAIIPELAPRVNQTLAVAMGFATGLFAYRRPQSLWIVGTMLVFMANPRGQGYTLCYLALPALALGFRGLQWRNRLDLAGALALVACVLLGEAELAGDLSVLAAILVCSVVLAVWLAEFRQSAPEAYADGQAGAVQVLQQ